MTIMDVPPRSPFRGLVGGVRHGAGDPCVELTDTELWWATRTRSGPGTLYLRVEGDDVHAEAFGPGGGELLGRVPGLLGAHDEPAALTGLDPVVTALLEKHGAPRLGRSTVLVPTLVATVLAQRVTSNEARRGWRSVVRLLGEPAPGPRALLLPPDPRRLASLPYYALHRMGIERRRADTVRRVATVAHRLEEAVALGAETARQRMRAVPGVGPWTVESVIAPVFGDPDAVPIGDWGLPEAVCFALTGERGGDDERMLALLEPYRGQRGRVIALLLRHGHGPSRRAPRAPIVPIADL